MIVQYAIVAIIVCLAVYCATRMARQTFRDTQNGCYGCKGCAMKEQMMKMRNKKQGKYKKMDCFHKKQPKTFGRSKEK